MGAERGKLSIDAVLKITSSARRRRLFAHMKGVDQEVFDLDALAEALIEAETGDSPPSDTIEEIKVVLHHQHLPQMAKAGLVEYDARNGDVRFRGIPATTPEDAAHLVESLCSEDSTASNDSETDANDQI